MEKGSSGPGCPAQGREAAVSERHPYLVSMSCGHQMVLRKTVAQVELMRGEDGLLRSDLACIACQLNVAAPEDPKSITIRTLAKEVAELAVELEHRLLWSDERSLRAEAARELLRRLGLA